MIPTLRVARILIGHVIVCCLLVPFIYGSIWIGVYGLWLGNQTFGFQAKNWVHVVSGALICIWASLAFTVLLASATIVAGYIIKAVDSPWRHNPLVYVWGLAVVLAVFGFFSSSPASKLTASVAWMCSGAIGGLLLYLLWLMDAE